MTHYDFPPKHTTEKKVARNSLGILPRSPETIAMIEKITKQHPFKPQTQIKHFQKLLNKKHEVKER